MIMTTISPPPKETLSPLCIPTKELQANFNRAAFAIQHNLVDNPAFSLSNLSSLMERRQKVDQVLWNSGDKSVGQHPYEKEQRSFSLSEAMAHIETTKAWIVLLDAQCEPEIGNILNACINQIEAKLGWSLSKYIKSRKALILITSPHRITSFHIDRECTFLLQIRGSKMIYTFSPKDREVVTEPELEQFWAGDNNAAHYRPEFQNHAFSFNMTPGTGIHIPVNAGHWLQNGDRRSKSRCVFVKVNAP